jgi:hypothetical protein
MKRIQRLILAGICAVALGAGLAACSNGATSTTGGSSQSGGGGYGY